MNLTLSNVCVLGNNTNIIRCQYTECPSNATCILITLICDAICKSALATINRTRNWWLNTKKVNKWYKSQWRESNHFITQPWERYWTNRTDSSYRSTPCYSHAYIDNLIRTTALVSNYQATSYTCEVKCTLLIFRHTSASLHFKSYRKYYNLLSFFGCLHHN